MSSAQPIGFAEATVEATQDSSWELGFVGPWQLLYGGTDLQTALEVRGLQSNLEIQIRFRVAKVDPNEPEIWDSATSSTITSAGEHEYTFDVSTLEGSNLWVQPAVFVRLALTTTTPQSALVRLWSSVLGAGWVIGRARFELQAGQTNVLPVGAAFSAAGVSGIRLAVTFIGIVGGVKDPDVAYQTFTTGNPSYPGSWMKSGNLTDAGAGNSKELYSVSTTTADKMLIQAGFSYGSTGSQYGVVEVIAVAKK